MSYRDESGRGAVGSLARISVFAFLTVLTVSFELHALRVLSDHEFGALVGLGLLASTSLFGLGHLIAHRAAR